MQGLQRIFRDKTIDGIEDMYNFKEIIDVSRVWADILNNNSYESDNLIKDAYPGNMKKKKECISWSIILSKHP